MNAKRAKRIRQQVRSAMSDKPAIHLQEERRGQTCVRTINAPNSQRGVYRAIKKRLVRLGA